ncbi:threonylcarbamoyladenosine tRNA methylthiotransferase MtaB [Desulfonispora thiosulfatigenes DSM 11270]|uniref:Threonylcarbamoyladenosine tRNA methylthiotransferase MtaB n=1 Tax=Desulfonispora thiosulfatigenes DSM 11270 TaxID=656914 RepID=A0A1W1VBS7_DESTI|nr:tRNA (N(6)-L-threonylcarbamoyladenosine(37)-C(2))-methylthiotransferase MtaB [Desulfonispora thiosulfatigenes]SMB90917.1 threonylcarbamoyladenosine tRNA methylthiotransferase MtaB [Desulfonispora thiosulfatigenes DSM 11270]
MSNENKKRVALYTLGCKVNQDETEAIEGLFKDRNYEIVSFENRADVYIINTCTVTHLADRKSRQFIRRAINTNPNALIVVTGCYAQTSADELEKIPGVDLIIGTSGREKIVDVIEEHQKVNMATTFVSDIRKAKDFEELPVDRLIHKTRAYLKVQEGCEQFCTYCIIPYSRGPFRSRSLDNCINEAGRLVDAGFKEIVLTGIHLGAYGIYDEKLSLFDLCKNLLDKTDIKRLRLSSIEPTEINDEIIELMKNDSRFCRHLHIPLQSGDNKILKLMNRPYDAEQFQQLVTKVKQEVPGASITTDFIVGFPGEDDESFANSVELIEKVGFSDIHVFKYSPRKGTPASKYPDQVEASIKEKRSKIISDLATRGFVNFASQFINQTVEVLVEQDVKGICEGHTDNYLPVKFKGKIDKGQIVKVKIKNLEKGFLSGELI